MLFGSNQRLITLLGCFCGVLAADYASADVIEIERDGAYWKSGGYGSGIAPLPHVNMAREYAASAPLIASATITTTDVGAGPDRWRSHIARLAVKYDISPALLEALVWQESRWRNDAISPVGARGLTQLMPGTARDLGVDPRDPLANLEGGARYLRMQLDTFNGDVELALAAYNAGPRLVARLGRIPNIPETRNYVAAIMARLAEPVRR